MSELGRVRALSGPESQSQTPQNAVASETRPRLALPINRPRVTSHGRAKLLLSRRRLTSKDGSPEGSPYRSTDQPAPRSHHTAGGLQYVFFADRRGQKWTTFATANLFVFLKKTLPDYSQLDELRISLEISRELWLVKSPG